MGACHEGIDVQDMFQDSGFGCKEEMGGSKVTYWSSAMSSRVRLSNREWISGLERTVSGILITLLK